MNVASGLTHRLEQHIVTAKLRGRGQEKHWRLCLDCHKPVVEGVRTGPGLRGHLLLGHRWEPEGSGSQPKVSWCLHSILSPHPGREQLASLCQTGARGAALKLSLLSGLRQFHREPGRKLSRPPFSGRGRGPVPEAAWRG